jgi:phenylpropionate dioxygenase-like ring-hydroxylating dioxygenase large terminal subunit
MNKPFAAARLDLDLAELAQSVAAHRGFPLHTYWHPDIFEFELDQIFSGAWRYFAPLERLKSPGDVVIGQIGTTPVAVTRAEDGQLHGFVNVCRHRGYPVVHENLEGQRLLRCRYHSWAYRLTGELAAAPDAQKDPGFDKCDFGLVPISVDSWGAGVFVNSDAEAQPLRKAHPQIETWTAEKGFETDPARHRLVRSVTTEIGANWKLWYDNGTECYHCPGIHGQSFAEAFDVADGAYTMGCDGQMTTYSHVGTPARDPDALRSAHYRSMQIFPGSQIIQQDDIMIMAFMNPTGPESCTFTVDYFAEEGADPARVERWIAVWNQTYDEDTEAVEMQQRNTRARHAARFRYVANREGPALFVNGLILDAYRRGLGAARANEA